MTTEHECEFDSGSEGCRYCRVEGRLEERKLVNKQELRFLKKIQFDNEADMGDLDEVQEMINKRIEKIRKELNIK